MVCWRIRMEPKHTSVLAPYKIYKQKLLHEMYDRERFKRDKRLLDFITSVKFTLEFSRNTQICQCWHFCVSFKGNTCKWEIVTS